MIQILGLKRIVTLAVLFALNVVLGVALYYFITPEKTRVENELRRVTGEVATRRTETEKLRTEYQLIQEQKSKFVELQKAGFFNVQDRVEARKMIEAIQANSHVLAAKYSLMPAEVVENKFAAEADHVVLRSPISFSIEALDDIDVYSFVYWLENSLPGHVSIENISIERAQEVDEVTLRKIGSGVPTVMVTAKIDMSWRTVVPRALAAEQLRQPVAQ